MICKCMSEVSEYGWVDAMGRIPHIARRERERTRETREKKRDKETGQKRKREEERKREEGERERGVFELAQVMKLGVNT